MTSSNTTQTRSVKLGRLPAYCGVFDDAYDSNSGYHRYNIVTFLDSMFINLVEDNKNEPVYVEYDASSGNLDHYNVDPVTKMPLDKDGNWTGWNFVANALDAQIWADKARYVVEGFVEEVVKEVAEEYLDACIGYMAEEVREEVTEEAIEKTFFSMQFLEEGENAGDIVAVYGEGGDIKCVKTDAIGDIIVAIDYDFDRTIRDVEGTCDTGDDSSTSTGD